MFQNNQIFQQNYQPYDRTKFKTKPKNEVIFLIGISGSGKSTYVEKNIDKNKYKILSVDNILSVVNQIITLLIIKNVKSI